MSRLTRVAGVLLAAGAGSRLGRPKALVEVAGTRLVVGGDPEVDSKSPLLCDLAHALLVGCT
jgi:hypothetical protein